MAGNIGSWGDSTFGNVISLLSKSPAWKKATQQSSFDWKPSPGTFQSSFADPLDAYKLAASKDFSFPGIGTFGSSQQDSASTKMTPYTPEGAPLSPELYEQVSALQRQNYDLADQYNARNFGLQQAYAGQLLSNAKDLRQIDLANSLTAQQALQNMPNAVASRGQIAQLQMGAASEAEAGMLNAIANARNVANAGGRIPRMGYGA